MKLVTKNKAFLLWGVMSFAILSLQLFNFIDDYHAEIDKHERINFLNAKNLADEMESMLNSEVDRIEQVSNVISYRLLDIIKSDHQLSENRAHNNIESHKAHHAGHEHGVDETDVSHEHFIHDSVNQWIVRTDKYLNDNFNISIQYVIEDSVHQIYSSESKSYEQQRFSLWLSNMTGNFGWQFVFDEREERVNLYSLNRLEDDLGHTYDVIIEFDEKITARPNFDSLHHFFLVSNSGVPFQYSHDRFLPVTVSVPAAVQLNGDADYIEQFYGKRPAYHVDFDTVEHYGKELFRLNGDSTVDYFYNTFYFKDLQWRFLILTNAAPLVDGIKGEFDELYEKLGVTAIIIISIGFILYYHFKVASLLQHDALTNLLNRNHFKEKDVELAHIQERDNTYHLGIIAIDIDKFKRVNDTYGHAVGDKVLKHLAKLMKKQSRQTDFVYRFGGEEFLILCPGDTAEQTKILAERLRETVEQDTDVLKVMPEGYTISLGVTEKAVNETMDDALKRADELLYKAKENGRNQVQFKAANS